jgi:hypothetical protein
VQPSSLIFLVLIAIWAAYLLQHWVRRREHLATARSVDRFSDAMRVLERRTPLPEFDLSAPSPRSYTVSPARPSRPEVVVKRAQSMSEGPPDPVAAVRSTRTFHVLAGVSARRLRGLSLLLALTLALVVSPLAALSVLPWWSALAAVGVLMADVAWLRHTAASGRATRGAQSPARRSSSGRTRSTAERSFASESELEFGPESQYGAEGEPAPEGGLVAETALGGVAEVAEPVESSAEVDPSGWAPVPVPPPTYTLKAMAPEPMAMPVPVPVPVTEPVVPERGVGEPWSLDGLVYDCELDELVQRRTATGA